MTVNSMLCKDIMHNENLTCVIASENEIIYKSDKKGILPMLEMLELYERGDIVPVYQADRIIGKAAVIIASHCGIKQIYADVISQSAYDIAENKNITIYYNQLVEMILNPARKQEGPFEAALHDVDYDDFPLVIKIVRETLEKIQKMNK